MAALNLLHVQQSCGSYGGCGRSYPTRGSFDFHDLWYFILSTKYLTLRACITTAAAAAVHYFNKSRAEPMPGRTHIPKAAVVEPTVKVGSRFCQK